MLKRQKHALSQSLEAQQRHSSYRAMLVAIVSQTLSRLFFFMGHRTIIARYVAERGIAQMRLCQTLKLVFGPLTRAFWALLFQPLQPG